MQKLAKGWILLAAASFGVTLQAAEWRQEVVDPTASGKFSSLQIDRSGNAHVTYMDEWQNLLKYSFWDHDLKQWFTTAIDTTRGYCALALDSKQHTHISYLAYGDGQIKHSYWNGKSWEKQVIRIKAKDISFYTSITLDPKDNPRVSYYEY